MLLLLTVLLRYGVVIRPGRRSATLLAGLAMGALLSCGFAVAAPAGLLPVRWQDVLGSIAVPAGDPPPSSTRPPGPPAPVPPPLPDVAPAAPPTPPPSATAPPTSTTKPPPPTTKPRPTTTAPTAPPVPAPPPAAPTGGSEAEQVAAATNAARAEAGCPALKTDPRLAAAAQGHAADMAAKGYFAHVGQDGREFGERIGAQGHPSPGGENIAQGQPDAASVVQAWLDSPGHRANILNCSFTGIGVGHAGDDDYWVQNFGR